MDTDKLVAAAQAVANGLAVVEPKLTSALLPAIDSDDFTLDEPLTPREMQVLQRLAEGLTNKAIAQELGISEHTIKFHVNAIMGKLQAQSRTEAVVRAPRLGLIHL
jgi:DNA-binding NarL/FixJ family response regulator